MRPWTKLWLARAGSAGLATTLLGICVATGGTASAQGKQTILGTITDDMCATADHARMRMGANDAECAKACVDAHGAGYVLYDGKVAYGLSDQKSAAGFAAKRVRVVGTVDAKTKKMVVESIRAES